MDKEDVGREASLYQIELLPGLDGTIALGNTKYAFSEMGVLFAPVYMVDDADEVVDQIGVYEFMSDDYPNLLDADGDPGNAWHPKNNQIQPFGIQVWGFWFLLSWKTD